MVTTRMQYTCKHLKLATISQYPTEKMKYQLYQDVSKRCTYALTPTFLTFIMITKGLFSLYRGCDTACADVRGNNKSTSSYTTVEIGYHDSVFDFFMYVWASIHSLSQIVQGEAAAQPPACPLDHRLLCHQSSAVRPAFERLRSGCLFVFSGSN